MTVHNTTHVRRVGSLTEINVHEMKWKKFRIAITGLGGRKPLRYVRYEDRQKEIIEYDTIEEAINDAKKSVDVKAMNFIHNINHLVHHLQYLVGGLQSGTISENDIIDLLPQEEVMADLSCKIKGFRSRTGA